MWTAVSVIGILLALIGGGTVNSLTVPLLVIGGIMGIVGVLMDQRTKK